MTQPCRHIRVNCAFLKIEDINTVCEQFTGLVFVKAKWREPAADGYGRVVSARVIPLDLTIKTEVSHKLDSFTEVVYVLFYWPY